MVLLLLGLLLAVVIVGLIVWAWLSEQGFVAQRVRIELEQRSAERQIQAVAYAAMQRMLEEVRREGR